MELITAPADWLPCYNARGEFVFADSVNEQQTFYDVFSIGPPNTTQQATFGVSASAILLQISGAAYYNDPNAKETGGFVEVQGTDNYDGIYRVDGLFPGPVLLLQGEANGPVEFGGEFRTHFANMRLYAELNIENAYTVKFRTDASANGRYIANIHDYLKDYFRFQLSQPQQGSFNLLSTTIRSCFSYAPEYDRVDRQWDGTKWVYIKSRVLEELTIYGCLITVNAALKYIDAFAAGSLAPMVVGPTSTSMTRLATYRPRTTFVGEDEDLFVTNLRSQASHTPQGLVVAYDAQNNPLQSIQVNQTFPTGYEKPHHILWNIGTSAITLPSNTAYYTFEVRVAGVQRSERMTVKIKNKCGAVQVMWKNEYGAPEVVSMYGINERSIGVNYATAGTSDFVGTANPSNYIKRSSNSPYRVTLNTGLIDTDHAMWLLGMARNTEAFVKLEGVWHPLVITPQQVGPVSSYNRTHNLTFVCEIPFEVAQIGNLTQ